MTSIDESSWEDPEDHDDDMFSMQGYCTGYCERCSELGDEAS